MNGKPVCPDFRSRPLSLAYHRPLADEARENIKGIADSVVQTKYIELVSVGHSFPSVLMKYVKFQEMRRIERDFSKEKQKLVKEKDACRS